MSAALAGVGSGAVWRMVAVVALLLLSFGCSYFLSEGGGPTDPNNFFVGCFTGAPANGGTVTLVMRTVTISEPGQSDRFSVQGCLDTNVEDLVETVVVSGMTTSEDPTVITLSGVLSGGTALDLTVERQPEGNDVAESVTIASTEDKLDGVDSTTSCSRTFEELCPGQLAVR